MKKQTNILKTQKKDTKKIKQSFATDGENQAGRIIKILLIVLVIFFAVYFIAAVLTGEIKLGNNKKSDAPAAIQYQEILVGESFKKNAEGYYVLYMDFTDPETQTFMTYSDLYSKKDKSLGVYYVDMEKGFNKAFATTEQSNSKATSVSELKIKSPTLVKFEKNRITGYIEGSENVLNHFKGLIK